MENYETNKFNTNASKVHIESNICRFASKVVGDREKGEVFRFDIRFEYKKEIEKKELVWVRV